MRFTGCNLIFGCVALLVSVGCDRNKATTSNEPATSNPAANSSARLHGVWEATERPTVTINGKTVEGEGDPITVRFEFRADGTLSADLFFPMTGTWKVAKTEGDTLTLDVEMNVPSGGFESKTENGKTTTKSEMAVKKEKDTLTVSFEPDDQITIRSAKDAGNPLKLKRKK